MKEAADLGGNGEGRGLVFFLASPHSLQDLKFPDQG